MLMVPTLPNSDFLWDPHPITSPPHILSHSFIPSLPESASRVSRQAGYWIQTPKLPAGLISSPVFVKRLFLKKPFKENRSPHLAVFWRKLK